MRCPYLQEAAVKSCLHAGTRTTVPGVAGADRCVTPDYARCAEWPSQAVDAAQARCPYLDERLMQYCAASAVRKMVPYNDAVLSRCAGEGDAYRYCEGFLDEAMPSRAGAACPPAAAAEPREERVDGVHVPTWLLYAPNHMWLDAAEDGNCHLGIDGFMARALESVDEVSFLTPAGTLRPAVVLTARGVDVLVVFPGPLRITAANLYLRANPERLVRDPYSLGWLFQAREVPGTPVRGGLATGERAVEWMRREVECLRRYPRPSGREDLIRMFHEFFSPMASRELEP